MHCPNCKGYLIGVGDRFRCDSCDRLFTIYEHSPVTMKRIVDLCKQDKKIEAIKAIRAEFFSGLKDSKDIIDIITDRLVSTERKYRIEYINKSPYGDDNQSNS